MNYKSVPTVRPWGLTDLRLETMGEAEGPGYWHKYLLQVCAPTLEILLLASAPSMIDPNTGSTDPTVKAIALPDFSRLHTLALRKADFLDASYHRSMLGPDSVVVRLELEFESHYSKLFFGSCTWSLKSLRTLTVRSVDDDGLGCLTKFLYNNHHLVDLKFSKSMSLMNAQNNIVPILRDAFFQLQSLYLKTFQPLSDIILHQISQIRSLRQLFVGTDITRQEPWLINHEQMIMFLRNLEHLKKLVICNDDYPTARQGPLHEPDGIGSRYYREYCVELADPEETDLYAKIQNMTAEEFQIEERGEGPDYVFSSKHFLLLSRKRDVASFKAIHIKRMKAW